MLACMNTSLLALFEYIPVLHLRTDSTEGCMVDVAKAEGRTLGVKRGSGMMTLPSSPICQPSCTDSNADVQ